MSAFGRRTGAGGSQPARPAFGVARPMQGAAPAAGNAPLPGNAPVPGGEQFPPLPGEDALDRPVDAATLRADAQTLLRNRRGQSGLWGYGLKDGGRHK